MSFLNPKWFIALLLVLPIRHCRTSEKGSATELSGPVGSAQSIVDWKLMLRDALRVGVDREPDVAAKIAQAREQIIVSEYLARQIREKVAIPETVLQDYYNRNREDFTLSEAIRVSHILVRSQRQAQEILKDLKKGADFSQLARERSLDPSRRLGGQLGWLERRVMDPDFARAAFAHEKAEITEVVHTKFGYHIIRVDDKRPAEYAAYERVKEGIRQKLMRQMSQEFVDQLKKELRAKAKLIGDERGSK